MLLDELLVPWNPVVECPETVPIGTDPDPLECQFPSPKEYSVESVEEKVVKIVSEQLDIPKEDIKLDSSFQEDLKADSLDVVELVMAFEDEFEVTIPDTDYEKIRAVGDAVKYISEKISG